MARVEIVGWHPGFRKVEHTKTLRELAGLSLAEAHSITERVLRGERVQVHVSDLEQAQSLAARIVNLGGDAKATS
jgi:ribosomal protein L7/L12